MAASSTWSGVRVHELPVHVFPHLGRSIAPLCGLNACVMLGCEAGAPASCCSLHTCYTVNKRCLLHVNHYRGPGVRRNGACTALHPTASNKERDPNPRARMHTYMDNQALHVVPQHAHQPTLFLGQPQPALSINQHCVCTDVLKSRHAAPVVVSKWVAQLGCMGGKQAQAEKTSKQLNLQTTEASSRSTTHTRTHAGRMRPCQFAH